MNPRVKRWLLGVGCVCLGLFVLGYCLRDFWIKQLRIYVLGLAEVRSDEYGYLMPEVDEIEVMTTGNQDSSASAGPDWVAHYKVLGRTTLHDRDAEQVAKLWRSLRRGRGFSAMCHDPIYGLRFRQHGKLLFETTVCWHCHNFTIPFGAFGSMAYGFDSQREDAQALLALLESHVPLPPKPHS